MGRVVLFAGALILPWLVLGPSREAASANQSASGRLRRPVALALTDNGNRLVVANRDSGTLSVLDTLKLQVVQEIPLGGRISDMVLDRTGRLLLAADEQTGEVVALQHREGAWRELGRRAVGLSPVSLRSTAGDLVAVACLWSRRLIVFEVGELAKAASGAPAIPPLSPAAQRRKGEAAVLDLPFAPRRLLAAGSDKMIVADSFAGKLAVVDLRRCRIDSIRDFGVHNIRGLALDASGQNLWLTHQVLHAQGRTTGGDIRTGNLLTNNVRRLSLPAVLDPMADALASDRLFFLGDVERGAGDPADVAVLPDGQVAVSLAGVNEVALGRPEQGIWTRLPVGTRPTALAVDPAKHRVYVANTFDDSISVIDWRAAKVLAEVRLGPPAKLRPEERGEQLFFDARLSFDAWFSCHSCHTDGHTSGRLNDNFTDGSFGTPKRVLSLLGVKDTGPWAWNGHIKDLESQVRTSLTSTMQGPSPAVDVVSDLAAFLRTLAPPPPLARARGAMDVEAIKRGRQIFSRQKCAQCHTPPTYTSAKTYDVGLRDEAGGKHFNPPSLRGLSQGGPYFHDNRAATLSEVFGRYRHELGAELSQEDLSDLLQFLGSL
jgi:YVTN family beta-propeller protein